MKHTATLFNRIPTALLIAVLVWSAAGVWARTAEPETLIVFDTFSSGVRMAPIKGRTPDKTDVPGGKWSVFKSTKDGRGGDVGFCAMESLSRHAPRDVIVAYPPMQGNISMDPGGYQAIAIPIASQGAYKKPRQFTISADLGGYFEVNAALGFFSAVPETGADDVIKGSEPLFKNFTGLIFTIFDHTNATPVGRGNGALTLYENGKPGMSVNFTGTFDHAHGHRLSYDVDTATGAISNVRLSGSASDYSVFKSSAFTDAATACAAVGNAMGLLSDTVPPGHRVWVVVNNFRVGVHLDPSLPVASGQPASAPAAK
ncbi:MAG: hypothetical protein WC789_03675 [Lentisphaeria bacterium]